MTHVLLDRTFSLCSSPPGAAEGVVDFSLSAYAGDAPARAARPAPGGRPMNPPASERPGPDEQGSGAAGEVFAHEPVMLGEILELFAAVPAGLIIDATVGGAGHAAALLGARGDLSLLGLDQDADALDAAAVRLAPFGDRADLRRARFDELAEALGAARAEHPAWAALPVAGVLFDLGVSSHQLDVAARGFSFRRGGPLDMRMDQRRSTTAAELVNTWSEAELARLFAEHGEARLARRLARAVVAARPLTSTDALAGVVEAAVPAAARRRGHPARRVFQALRVAVNEELDVLPVALDTAIALLEPAGRCVVLAYHSGEDRIVKDRFRTAATGGCTCPPGLPCGCGAAPTAVLLTRSSRRPTAQEIAANPRAEAARLRALERIVPGEVRR